MRPERKGLSEQERRSARPFAILGVGVVALFAVLIAISVAVENRDGTDDVAVPRAEISAECRRSVATVERTFQAADMEQVALDCDDIAHYTALTSTDQAIDALGTCGMPDPDATVDDRQVRSQIDRQVTSSAFCRSFAECWRSGCPAIGNLRAEVLELRAEFEELQSPPR